MSKIEDLLNRTVREEKNVTKGSLSLTVYIVITCSVIISFGLFFAVYYVADVDGYLQDNKGIINLYDFYDQKVGEYENAVFFIGSSIVRDSIYSYEINNLVKKKYPNITAYNLGLSGSLPIDRTLEIQKIIDSKPSLVIFGITYRSVNDAIDYARFFEITKLVHSRLDIRDDSFWLFTESETKYFAPISDLEKKKYLVSAIEYKCSPVHQSINYSSDPVSGQKYLWHVSIPKNTLAEWVNKNGNFRPVITNESTRYKDALIYNVKTLQDAGIPVIILNMPLHPLLSERITDESRANFYDLLNETGAEWYDFERDYDGDCFRDGVHANFDGALKFAPRMADLIIEQVEKDVIHYT